MQKTNENFMYIIEYNHLSIYAWRYYAQYLFEYWSATSPINVY